MSRTLALQLAPPDPLGIRWAMARGRGRTYLAWRRSDGTAGVQITRDEHGVRHYAFTDDPPYGLWWVPLRQPWTELPKQPDHGRKEQLMRTAATAGVWECGNCGRDNPEGRPTCILCGLTPDGQEGQVDEKEEAARLIREAEREFSEMAGQPINLRGPGRPVPTTIEEAERLIEETQAAILMMDDGPAPGQPETEE